jgi:hypothetical protein
MTGKMQFASFGNLVSTDPTNINPIRSCANAFDNDTLPQKFPGTHIGIKCPYTAVSERKDQSSRRHHQ